MRKQYDLKNLKGKKNPYIKKLKKQITIRLDEEIIEYFKKLSMETEIEYQKLINMYLKECTVSGKKPEIKWKKTG